MKEKFNRLLCRIFGHKLYEEVYAVRCDRLFGTIVDGIQKHKRKYLYIVFRDLNCRRCGVIMTWHSKPMRRSELLKRGWFIEQ